MTVKEIAELASVSIGTVDRVLHKRGRVSVATKEKIEHIIEKYQFVPNPIARSLKQNRPYKICVFLPRRDQDAGYWGQVMDGIKPAIAELAPLGIVVEVVEFDRYGPGMFEAKAETVLKKEIDGLVFAPIMPQRTMPFVSRIHAKNIPYVFIDADIPGLNPLCTINQDSFRGGYLAGRLMHLMRGISDKPAAILNAHGGDYHITRRKEGFLSYTAEYGIPTITREQFTEQSAELSDMEIVDFLKIHPEISGVFITNCFAYRVVQAARKIGRERELIIIGYDLIPENRCLIKEGSINAVISQRPEYQGRESLMNLFRFLVLGQKIPEKIEIPLDVFIKENIID
ncbi:LacI family DNA-binding transcriptional regulator [Leadbettera azotonutricia]|uniref:Putative LacI-family transcriptional regulator n=1 Tax=Leadbettera azotonutricia (strain ATCC BAA-888 / DSM 13862 / ZAS-9) TaxID=545695 RepID=F5YBW8_LEAAZ|nr:LacI family DNA-binding transcriptional regulator [Leadbettera azotonutricia]AEF80808.1 putative LacI-family transcriptional regulator [Leadbettera azotonutricia ZAS-9]